MAKPRTKIKVDQLAKLPHYPDFVPDQIAKARSKIVDLIIGVVLVAAVGLGVYFARDELLGLMVIIALGWPFSIVIVLILITVPVCLVMAPYLIKRDDPK